MKTIIISIFICFISCSHLIAQEQKSTIPYTKRMIGGDIGHLANSLYNNGFSLQLYGKYRLLSQGLYAKVGTSIDYRQENDPILKNFHHAKMMGGSLSLGLYQHILLGTKQKHDFFAGIEYITSLSQVKGTFIVESSPWPDLEQDWQTSMFRHGIGTELGFTFEVFENLCFAPSTHIIWHTKAPSNHEKDPNGLFYYRYAPGIQAIGNVDQTIGLGVSLNLVYRF